MPRLVWMPPVLLALLLVSGSVTALEPETVSVVGRVEIDPKNATAARDQALRVALLEAALEVAWRIVPPEVMLWTLHHLRDRYGGIDEYLLAGDMTPEGSDLLRGALLE